MDTSVAAYCDELSQAVQSTLVTDGNGTALSLDDGASRAVEMFMSLAASTSGKVMLIGNGGSAAIVSHIQNDLCKAVGLRAMVFNEPPLLTALSNDDGYETAFEQCVRLWASPADLLFCVSSSGNSENLLRAMRTAASRGTKSITMSGFKPNNSLRQMGDLNFYVPAQAYGFVEVSHQALGHFLTDSMMRVNAAKRNGSV